jgi:hypothetical protein
LFDVNEARPRRDFFDEQFRDAEIDQLRRPVGGERCSSASGVVADYGQAGSVHKRTDARFEMRALSDDNVFITSPRSGETPGRVSQLQRKSRRHAGQGHHGHVRLAMPPLRTHVDDRERRSAQIAFDVTSSG